MADRTISGGELPTYAVELQSLCTRGTPVCALHNELVLMKKLLTSAKVPIGDSPDAIVASVIKLLGVADEASIWTAPQMVKLAGAVGAADVLRKYFKPRGPAGSVDLLNNHNIDGTLALWQLHSVEQFGKKFAYVPFQMIDFAAVGSELADCEIVYRFIKSGVKAFGVVLNTDVSSGRGKHWFCIYGDLDHAGTAADPHVIEYFNSSGFPPMAEVVVWIEKVIDTLAVGHNIVARRHDSVPKQLQKSHTECGVWSLMYIRSRLDGHPPDWFYRVRATDDDITEMRRLFFRE